MLRGGEVNEIIELRRQGLSITRISTLTGYDRKTIRKYLKTPKLPRYGPRLQRGSRLDPFTAYIQERLSAGVWNAVVLLAELKERGYQGDYTTLKDYLRPLRREAACVAVRRFETPPGEQAQVDWGTTVINIRGESYRLKERRKAGLLATPANRERALNKEDDKIIKATN